MHMSRLTALLSLILALSFGLPALPAGGHAPPPETMAAAKKKVRPYAVVKVTTPSGVPANVVVTGPQKRVLVKGSSGRSKQWKAVLKPGRYRVKAAGVVHGGVRYAASAKPATFKVPKAKKGKKYRAPKVTVTLREVKVTTMVEAARVTPTEVELRWLVPASTGFAVVRTVGETAATQPGAGTTVATSGPRTIDRSVQAGTTYTYALLLKSGKTWRLSSQQVVGVPELAGAPAIEKVPYAVAPTAVRVAPGERDVPEIAGGQVWVRLAPGRPTPLLGAGFSLPPSTALPDGFLGRVAEISVDGRRVRLEQGGLPDLFSYLDLDLSLAGPTETLPIVKSPSVARRMLAERARATGQPVKTECQGQAGVNVTVHGPNFTPGGYVRHHIDSTWGVPHTLQFEVRSTHTISLAMDLELSGGLSCGYVIGPWEKTFFPAGVPLALSFHPSVDVSVNGKVKVENIGGSFTSGAWAKGSVGLNNSYEQGPVHQDHNNIPKVSFEGEASVRLGGWFSVGLGGADNTTGTSFGAVLGLHGDVDFFKLSGRAVFADPTAGPCAVVETTSRLNATFGLRAWAGPFEYKLETPSLLDFTYNWSEPQYYPKGCEVVIGEGDVLATLSWRSEADLDLHVFEPSGEEIWYADRNSATGGYLDTDANAGCSERRTAPQENVTWPSGKAPKGSYRISVVVYDRCDQAKLEWNLVVKVGGRTVLNTGGSGNSPVYEIKYGDPLLPTVVRELPAPKVASRAVK